MSDTPAIHMRADQPSHEGRVLALFEEVFEHRRDADRWRWQYRDSPQSPGVIDVALAGEDVVGCAGLMRQDLNHLGDRVASTQACDGMLRRDVRGGGRYAALATSNYASATRNGFHAVIGFPNQNSFTTLLRNLGHSRILVLRHYYRRIGTRRVVGGPLDRLTRPAFNAPNRVALQVLKRRIGRPLAVHTTTECPSDLEQLLRTHRQLEVLSIWKDPEYLVWRYQDHPTYEYRFHVLREDGDARALAVTRITRNSVAICEMIHPRRDVREAAHLLRSVVDHHRTAAGPQIVEFFGWDISFFDTAFREAGFAAESHSHFVMIGRVLDSHSIGGRIDQAANWTVAYGDTDVI